MFLSFAVAAIQRNACWCASSTQADNWLSLECIIFNNWNVLCVSCTVVAYCRDAAVVLSQPSRCRRTCSPRNLQSHRPPCMDVTGSKGSLAVYRRSAIQQSALTTMTRHIESRPERLVFGRWPKVYILQQMYVPGKYSSRVEHFPKQSLHDSYRVALWSLFHSHSLARTVSVWNGLKPQYLGTF